MNLRAAARSWLFADAPASARRDTLQGASGSTGVQFLAGQIKAGEFNTALTGTRAVETYEKMRREAMVRATLNLVNLPIRSAQWEIDCEDEKVRDFLKEALFERIDFDQYLTHCLLAFVFGYEVMEKVWKVEGGRYWLEGIEHRAQSTLWQWIPDAATGQLAGIVQRAYKNGTFGTYSIPEKADLETARLKLVHLAWDQEGNNFEGISGLRSAYPYWYAKMEVFKIAAIALERFGLGIPIAEPPYDQQTQTAKYTEGDKSAAETIMRNMRGGAQAYVFNPGGWKFDILGTSDANRYDPMPFISYCDQMISMNILAQAINLGTTATGSRAVAESQFGMFLLALETVANLIKARTEKWVIQPLVELNFPNAPKACLRWSDLEVKNKAAVADYVAKLELAGLLTPDHELEEHLRAIGDLPPMPEEEEGAAPKGKKPPMPPAEDATDPEDEGEDQVQAHDHGHHHSRRSFGVSGLKPTYWRELTTPERAMALQEIRGRQDDGREQIARVYEDVRPEWIKSLQEQIRAAAADGDFSDLDEIEIPTTLIKPAQKEVNAVMGELYGYGRRTIRDELARQQKRAASAEGGTGLRDGQMDGAEMKDLFWTRSGKYLRRLSRAVEEYAIESAIGQVRTTGAVNEAALEQMALDLLERFDSTARLEAQVLVGEAFNLGRDAEAELKAEDIEKAVYSAILDENVCDTCAGLDGEEYEVGEPDYYDNAPPNKNCDSTASGTNYCRCLYVYVSKSEQKARG